MSWTSKICFYLLVATVSILLYVTPGLGLECFICSYSPRGNTSRMDGCTDANFTEEMIETRTCDLGCESVTVFDLNGEMESFHRNCATNSTIITNSCEMYKTIVLTRRVCSCNYSYCNVVSDSGNVASSKLWVVLGPALLTWILTM